VTSSVPSVGELVTTPLTGGTVTVEIAQQYYYSATSVTTGGVAFHPLTVGETTITTSIPGYFALPVASQVVTVNP
jgi:hypothetical protein